MIQNEPLPSKDYQQKLAAQQLLSRRQKQEFQQKSQQLLSRKDSLLGLTSEAWQSTLVNNLLLRLHRNDGRILHEFAENAILYE